MLVQYLPTYPSYFKAKSSGCLTQWRVSSKCNPSSAQNWVSAAGASPQGCCAPWRCARVSWTQAPAEAPAQSTKNHPLKTAENIGCDVKGADLHLEKRQQYLPAAYRRGSWEYFGSHRPPPWRRAENKTLLCSNHEALSAAEVREEWLKQEQDITDDNSTYTEVQEKLRLEEMSSQMESH